MKTKPIIKAQSLNIWYNGFQAIRNLNIEIQPNTITALIGPSGSGKSTFLRSLNRIIELIPKARIEGKILINGNNRLDDTTDVTELRRNVGMVFQNPTPFPKSIYDNVSFGLEIQGVKKVRRNDFFGFFTKKIDPKEILRSKDEMDKRVVASLKESNLWEEVKDRLTQSAFKLSGGQQQRLCIARAIAVRPQVLLLDEPCSELDPISTKKIEQLLINLKKNFTILIVTHNIQQAKRISDQVGFFHKGELIEFNNSKKFFSRPESKITKDYIDGAFG